MTLSQAWKGISLGIFLIALALILHSPEIDAVWILPVLAAMSFVNAVLKRSWRFAPHPLLWCAALAWAIRQGDFPIGLAILYLCGISIILAFLIGLIPHRRKPAPPPPRPGAGVVIDVEVTKRD